MNDIRITSGEELCSVFMEEWLDSSDTVVCHTSGSTGTPKEIRLPKREMLRSARRSVDFFGLTPASHIHCAISIDTIGGKMALLRAILSGASFSCEKPSNRPSLPTGGTAISLLSVVPSQLIHLLSNEAMESLPAVERYLVGGAPLTPDLSELILRRGATVFESYGMTETASHIALRKISSENPPFTTLQDITVADREGTLLIDIPGWGEFLTNDVAEVFSPRTFRILGRADNAIISGGKKIHPEEVERRLSGAFTFPFMITSEPDPLWGKRVVLIAETLTSGNDKLSECKQKEIILTCKRLLNPWEVPKKVTFGHIPRTPNGKIKRY